MRHAAAVARSSRRARAVPAQAAASLAGLPTDGVEPRIEGLGTRPASFRKTVWSRVALLLALLASAAAAEPKRDVPNYDGRGNPDAKPSAALWVPRVFLAPLYAVHEYAIRRPFGALVKTAERHQWVHRIQDLIEFGPNRDMLVFPTLAYDFGMLPSVGASFRWRNALVRDNAFWIHAATWGPDWLATHADDTYTWDGGAMAETTRVALIRRDDNLFFGTGPDVTSATRTRYGMQRADATEQLSRRFTGSLFASLAAGVRSSTLREGTCCGDPALADLIASGAMPMPPGYDSSHLTVYERATLRLDSRRPRPAPGTGAYLELHGEDHVDVRTSDAWVRYGGEAGLAFDLDGLQRNLKLLIAAELVDPIGGHDDVPFYELAQLGGQDMLTGFLGGEDTMSGFLRGWMNGRSVITSGVAYTWPVWTWLDGQARLSVGNAFDDHFDGFAASKLRLSADVGITATKAHADGLQLLIGVGTETFEQGGRITSVRVSLGSRSGF
jgi:hypothetical protein